MRLPLASSLVWGMVMAWFTMETMGAPGADATLGESTGGTPFSAADLEFFERRVRPLLARHCYACHSSKAEKLAGHLRLDARGTILAGGDTGPAIVPGKPDESLLIDAIRYGNLYQMPPKSQLAAKEIKRLVQWVARGAPWPEEAAPGGPAGGSSPRPRSFDLRQRQAAHWAWHPIADPQPPPVADTSWPRGGLDHFILARLEAHALHPAADADPRTLVRRAYFDLIGLPPPPDQVAAWVADPSPEAWAQLVDRLLLRPQFGERWARHWLDLMRYAETRGHEFDFDVPNAWQYRDYVIRALNADVPYDQFVTEHIAGDLLKNPRRHQAPDFNESVLGTGFWYLGEWVHSPVDILQDEADRIDNAVDVFSKAFLGLTVSCARCHDHKFDAISQRDYYALAGYLQSSSYHQVRFESHEQNLRVAGQLDAARRATGRRIAIQMGARCEPLSDRLDTLLQAAVQWVQEGSDPRRFRDLASRTDLPTERLRSWASQLAAAVDDPRHPLHDLALAAAGGQLAGGRNRAGSVAGSGFDLASSRSTWRNTLRASYRIVVDYDDDQPAWMVDGPAFGAGPLRRGEVLAGTSAAHPIAEIVAYGRAQLRPRLAQLTLAPGTQRDPGTLLAWTERSGKTLRTPTVELTDGKLYYLLRGGAQVQVVVDSHRLIAGPLHGGLLKVVVARDAWRWVEQDVTDYRGHGAHVEFSQHQDEPLELALVVQGDTLPATLPPALDPAVPVPAAALAAVSVPGSAPAAARAAVPVSGSAPAAAGSIEQLAAAAAAKPEDISILCRQYAALLRQAIDRLAAGKLAASPGHLRLASWLAAQPRLWTDPPDAAFDRLLARARMQRERILQTLVSQSATAPACWDGSGEDQRLFIRGNPKTPGPRIPRRMLTALAGSRQPPPRRGSGRLELARRLLDPANPFPARVMANRIWQHLLGRGIVATVDNFGVLGQPPTHPELLDYLARQLLRDGWSLKRLIRSIMLSRTYQMSSQADPRALAVDPENRWLQHRPLRRLEAEAIRDAILTVSGRLNPKMYGPSVPIHLTPFMQGRGRPKLDGPLDGRGRRSIYVAVRRNFLAPMMLAFDTPQPARPVGRRNQSNVPAQALILMNDPFVAQQALAFARRLLQSEPDCDQRIDRLYQAALCRSPRAAERTAVRQFLAREAAPPGRAAEQGLTEEAIWTDLCQVMFNVKEFIYLQ